MKRVEPRAFIIAETKLTGELNDYIQYIGSPDWVPDQVSDGEILIEAAGRLCYRSWEAYNPEKPDATNPNVSRVRKGNYNYVGNLLAQEHGSVLEHCVVSVLFANVSRVFTHELVRHRLASYSQESLRYVRLNSLSVWFPEAFRGGFEKAITELFNSLETIQNTLFSWFKINEEKDFKVKKVLTSAFRRLAPIGLATNIIMTANLRTWRHVLTKRTAGGAEEEMQLVMRPIFYRLQEKYPSVFQDAVVKEDGSIEMRSV